MDVTFGTITLQAIQSAAVLGVAPLLVGFVRKIKAQILRRQGPPVIQPWRDLVRLLRKEAVLAENASWLFRAAPYLILALTWVSASLVPVFAVNLPMAGAGDLIVIVALLASARFVLTLAGMDIGTSFGGIGSSREAMIGAMAEPAMMMVIFTLALIAGSTQISHMAEIMASSQIGLRVSIGLALVALMMVALAENARIPVDNPSTHLELTMVHEAMVLEYSGRHLAMIELAAALKLLLYVSLIGSIFTPWGLAGVQAVGGWGASLCGGMIWIVKLLGAGVALAVFETSIAKMRVFRVPDFLGAALMLGLLATLLLFVSRGL